jgi:predicted DCC family thiol-disulfide oxidoreductase YuxK
MPPTPEPSPDCVTVLYDGACPLCRREIGVYRNLDPLQPVAWRDVSAADAVLPEGGARQTYMARFHVQLADGQVVSGAEAFVALWAVLPGWRWLARAARLPGMLGVMEGMYRLFLRIRPRMQGIARWLEARQR